MKVLVTGSAGFAGKNLVESLKCIRDGKDRRSAYQSLLPLTIYEFDRSNTHDDLVRFCSECDFVIHFAGVNRPKDTSEFMEGNFGVLSDVLDALKAAHNKAPIVLSSSTQASLEGRFAGSEYGKSKLAAEEALRAYGTENNVKTHIYRFPNLYGKWCKPNYNSAVATFCNNIANDLPIQVNDRSTELTLLYIDDLVHEMLNALVGQENRSEDGFCYAEPTDTTTLGEIVDLLYEFNSEQETLMLSDLAPDSFTKKLHSTFLSYLPPERFVYKPKMNIDERGSFTELIHSSNHGQVSVNISKPGITKGQHWHHTKWEKFIVIKGTGLIQLRRIGKDENGNDYPIYEYRVNGEDLSIVEMIPGYTHNIINLSETEDMVTVMWCNEIFDSENPDTFGEEV